MGAENLHLKHPRDYAAGRSAGSFDAKRDGAYMPRVGATGSEDQKNAYSLGYCDGWEEQKSKEA